MIICLISIYGLHAYDHMYENHIWVSIIYGRSYMGHLYIILFVFDLVSRPHHYPHPHSNPNLKELDTQNVLKPLIMNHFESSSYMVNHIWFKIL